jgi:MFS family permease
VSAFKVIASYHGLELGFSAAELGYLAASFSVPPLLFAFHAGRWTDHIGGLRVSLVGDVLILAGMILTLTIPGPVALLLAAGVMGLGALFSIIGQQALIAATATPDEQERLFGTMFSANAVGQMLGPLAATILAAWSTGTNDVLSVATGYLVAAGLGVLCLATLPFYGRAAWRRHDGTAEPPPPALHAIRSILSVKGAGPIIVFNAVIVSIIDMMTIFLPAWGIERQISPAIVGALLALRSAASIVVRFSMMALIRLAGRRGILVASGILTAGCLCLLPVANLPLASLIVAVLGLAVGLAPPISMAWISLAMPAALRGSAVGFRISVNRLAQASIPAIVGTTTASVAGMLVVSAALVGLASLLLLKVPFPKRR